MQRHVSEAVLSTLGSKAHIAPDTDLFAYGVDSIQSTRIRNLLAKTLDLGEVTLGGNIVYEYPSVIKLSHHLLELQKGSASRTAEQEEAEMLKMVDQFASMVGRAVGATAPMSASTAKGDVVVSLAR